MEPRVKKLEDFNAEDRIDVKLLDNSVFFLTGDIEEENITKCIKWITYENLGTKADKVLTLYINSSGGDLYQAFALIDVIQTSKYSVRTIGLGSIMSAAFLIFAAGSSGERYIGKNTGIMCHQFSDSQEGKYHDIKAQAKENELCNSRMVEILKTATGLPTIDIDIING